MAELPLFIKKEYTIFRNKAEELIRNLGRPPYEYRNFARFLKELYSLDYIRRIIGWAKEEVDAELPEAYDCAKMEVAELFIDELMRDVGKFDAIGFLLPKQESGKIQISLLGFPILYHEKFNDIKVVELITIETSCRELLKRKNRP